MNQDVFNMIKRLGAFVIGIGLTALDNKLGLNLDASSKAAITTMVLGFIGQSVWHSAQKAQQAAKDGGAAAAQVATASDAAKVFNTPPMNPVLIFLLAAGLMFVPTRARADDGKDFQNFKTDIPYDAVFVMKTGALQCANADCSVIQYAVKTPFRKGLIIPAAATQPVDEPLPVDQPLAATLNKGDQAPADGVFMPTPLAVANAKRIISCETEREELRQEILSSTGPKVWQIVVAIAAGALVGVGGGVLLERKIAGK